MRVFYFGLAAWFFLGFLAAQSFSFSQDKDKEKGKTEKELLFETVDGVLIYGNFFPGNAKTSPVAMLVHSLGEDCRKNGWDNLIEELQAKGYAVMSFDLRGHGSSTKVKPDIFWAYPTNRNLVKKKDPAAIDFKDFDKSYYTVLANDLAAARAYIDRENDKEKCNAAKLILIGTDTGATLAALWLNQEWNRYRLNMFGKPDTKPQGKDAICTVWLSPSTTLGRAVSLGTLMQVPGRVEATPTLLIYGEEDAKGKEVANQLERFLKSGSTKDKDRFKYTLAYEVKETKATGLGLLQKDLGVDKKLVETYLEEVVRARDNLWEERKYDASYFIWKQGNFQIPAKALHEKLMKFDTYEKFLR